MNHIHHSTIAIAPMMSYTDRHFRRLARLLSRHTLLYTEMITTAELLRGNSRRVLDYHPAEHPLALQLAGSNPRDLALCARLGEEAGYDEINLNVGCPSERVQRGHWGACLMKEPTVVAEAVMAMQEAVSLPVTVKTRVGVDDQDTYAHLQRLIDTLATAGCHIFILHARKAWLKGLNPKENRRTPPLQYDFVYRVKRDFPDLTIVLNGGISTSEEIRKHLMHVDGVMIGRQAYAQPAWIASFDREFYHHNEAVKMDVVLKQYVQYMEEALAQGARLPQLLRHLSGLFQGRPGARRWRRELQEVARQEPAEGLLFLQRPWDVDWLVP
ncbi:MAG: tRNA dihydrouridine(20/20a) synthase DusA [Coxiella sp. RIFCSPHIGHO2_12_FULL_44_14]|nr:MAG: tRNA dihydrouridine(20/20a) synthase DusA [Coxiella sp. RIFCSPHIGHO2_12_FULL_44_14]